METRRTISVAKPVKSSLMNHQESLSKDRRGEMAKANLGGMEIEIDEDGFIQEPDKWNKNVAEDLAKT